MDILSPHEEASRLIAQMVMKGMSEIPTSFVPYYLNALIESSRHHQYVVVDAPIEFSAILLNDES